MNSDSNPEVEYLTYQMESLQAEVSSLKKQLQEETKRAQELKSLKTQQVCALTFKLASAIRQREMAEENASKIKAEMENLKAHGASIHGGVDAIRSCQGSEEPGKLGKIHEEDGKFAGDKEEHGNGSDNEDSKSDDTVVLCSRKVGITTSQNDIQKMIEGKEEGVCNESEDVSYNGYESSSAKDQRDLERRGVDVEEGVQENSNNSDGDFNKHQPYQELVSQEFSRIQEELGEVKENMSVVQALNQRLSEDLQNFADAQKSLEKEKSIGSLRRCEENKRQHICDAAEDELSPPISPRPGMVDVEHHGTCVPHDAVMAFTEKVETFEDSQGKIKVEVAVENHAEKPSDQDSSGSGTVRSVSRGVCGSTMADPASSRPQMAVVSQKEKRETFKEIEGRTETEGWQKQNHSECDNAILQSSESESGKAKLTDTITMYQVQQLKEQLMKAMAEIKELRLDNYEMKRELRKISTSGGSELLMKTTKFTDQLLREMKQRETAVYPNVTHHTIGEYSAGLEPQRFACERYEIQSSGTTADQYSHWSARPEISRAAQGLEQSPKPSLPLRLLGSRLQEMTDTLDDMTNRPQEQDFVQRRVEDTSTWHSRDSISSPSPSHSFALEHYGIGTASNGEFSFSSRASDGLGYAAIPVSSERTFAASEKLGELWVRTGNNAHLLAKGKAGFIEEEKSKPLDLSRAMGHSSPLHDSRKPLCTQYTNDYIQRHIVRSSDYIAKLRDLRPEELDGSQGF